MLEGSGSDTTRRRVVLRSTWIAALTTTVPRLNGPATAGTTMESPSGAPPYAPVRYTRPPRLNGLEPAPDATRVVPTWESAPQVPAAACAAPQSGTRASRPVSPEGSVTAILEISCWPSGRDSLRRKPVLRPATGFGEPATKDGAKPPEHPATLNVLEAPAGASAPFHEVSDAFVTLGPQLAGVASGARGPPLNLSTNRLNGSMGVLSNVAVRRPVL